jgi:hypothetical protein
MYFNKLGTTEYNGIVIPDILKRISLTGDISKSNLVDQYSIGEGETPESISFNYYGSVDYYWTILITNNIKSRYFDWPMSSQELGQYVESKYGNMIALFFRETDLNNGFNLCDTKYVKNSVGKISPVLNCDRNLNKIVISNKYTTTRFDSTTSATGVVQETGPELQEAEGSITEEVYVIGNVELLDINRKTISSLPLGRIVYENMYAVHHTQDGDENRTYLNSYIESQGQNNIVSNYDYEVQENENKRNIFLINPTYISTYVNAFKALARAD